MKNPCVKKILKELALWGSVFAVCAAGMFFLYVRPEYVESILPSSVFLVPLDFPRDYFLTLGIHSFFILFGVASFFITVLELLKLVRQIRSGSRPKK